jgi:hypothetical protein
LYVSKAPWVAFLDADDYWHPEHLAELAAVRAACPLAGLASTAVEVLETCSTQSTGRDRTSRCSDAVPRIGYVNYFLWGARDIRVVTSSSVAVKTQLAQELGGFGSHAVGTDLEFWARCSLAAPAAHSTKVTAFYVADPEGVMAQTAKRGFSRSREMGQLLDTSRPHWEAVSIVSPAAGMLLERLDSMQLAGDERDAILEYVDAALMRQARSSLMLGDRTTARAVAALAARPDTARWRAQALFAALPTEVVRSAVAARQSGRRIWRECQGLGGVPSLPTNVLRILGERIAGPRRVGPDVQRPSSQGRKGP